MEELALGPNGGLIYCFKTLEDNFEWLSEQLKDYNETIFVVDLPGQLELFLNSDYLNNLIKKLKKLSFSYMEYSSLMLFDSIYSFDKNKFLSCNIYSLISMINLEISQINILSKIDLLKQNEPLSKRLDFYLENNEIEELFEEYNTNKFVKNIVDLIKNYDMIKFWPCDITDKVSLGRIINEVFIKLNYYVYTNDKDLKSKIVNISSSQSNIELYLEEEEEKIMLKELEEFK